MIIIGGSSHTILAQKLANRMRCDFIIADIKKFADQELKIHIAQQLQDRNVVILQSTTRPVNDHLMELFFLADTAKRAGSQKITAIIPYFGYSRQDKPFYKCGPIPASLVARLMETSGIDKIITVDMHSPQSEGFFKIGMQNLDPTDLFANALQNRSDYMVISPDVGGVARAKALASKLGVDLGIISKTRDAHGKCNMSDIIGTITKKDCIIIDDIVDTGSTLCAAAQFLIQGGAHSVTACVTHAVFSEDCVRRISQVGFSEFFITDTIYQKDTISWVKTISVQELIANAILPTNVVE